MSGYFLNDEPPRLYTIARDGTDLRGVILGAGRGSVLAWNAPPERAEADLKVCAAGSVVPAPEQNPGLVQDCQTLLGLRNALAGRAELNWNGEIPIAAWEGITLGGEPLRVHGLILGTRGLTGRLLPELGKLAELRYLVFDRSVTQSLQIANTLTGAIPPEIGQLTKLVDLRLSGNYLSGEIPPELGYLTNLGILRLDGNYLSGSIPTELSALKQLQELTLTGNELSGCVPAELPETWVEASGLSRCTN